MANPLNHAQRMQVDPMACRQDGLANEALAALYFIAAGVFLHLDMGIVGWPLLVKALCDTAEAIKRAWQLFDMER